MLVKCDYCGKDVNKKPCFIKTNEEKGHKNYCNGECARLSKIKRNLYYCAFCNAELHRTPGDVASSKSGNMFCNHSCAASFNNVFTKAGEKSSNWKDGLGSYAKLAYKAYKNHCAICKFDVMPALQVHHIDENRKNKEIDNLIILCANCHTQVHWGDLKITEAIKQSRELN